MNFVKLKEEKKRINRSDEKAIRGVYPTPSNKFQLNKQEPEKGLKFL